MWDGYWVACPEPASRFRHRWLSESGPDDRPPTLGPPAMGPPGIGSRSTRRAAAMAATQKQRNGE
jgi:hypothetical protein